MARTSNERALEVPLCHVCFCHHCQIYIVSTSTTCTVRKLLCVLATGDETVFERSFGTADRRIATCLITTAWCDVPDQAIFLGAKTGGRPEEYPESIRVRHEGSRSSSSASSTEEVHFATYLVRSHKSVGFRESRPSRLTPKECGYLLELM